MQTISRILSPLLWCFISISLFACKTNLLVLEDVMPSAKQEKFDVSFHQETFDDFSVSLKMAYNFRNPYDKDLPIPDHFMGVIVDDQDTLDLKIEKNGLKVPAKSTTRVDYDIELGTDVIKQIWGKDAKITFLANMDLDLTDFSSMLPNYQFAVTENFDIETSDLSPVLEKLVKKRLGSYPLELSYSTFVKIPSPPLITAATEPIEIRLLGEGLDIINLNEVKNALLPFGDLLINGNLNGLTDPFVEALVESNVIVPAPTLTNWANTDTINMANRALDLLRPVVPGIDTKWIDLKNFFYRPHDFKASDFVVDEFLQPYVDDQASEKWDSFQENWNTYKTVILPNQIPGPNTYGFEILIPFTFRNTNEFEIKVPILKSGIYAFGGQPFTVSIKPKDVQEISLNEVPDDIASIPAKGQKTLYIVFSFNMADFSNGMYSIFMQEPFNPNMKGIMSYDFGYGPMYFKYDLNEMNMEYN